MFGSILATILGLPSWAKAAIVAAAVLGGLEIKHAITDRGLRHQIEDRTKERDEARAEGVQLKTAVADLQANNADLRRQIVNQNSAIASIQAKAQQEKAEADLRASRVLAGKQQEIATLRAQLRRDVPPGQEGMNSWFATVLPR